MMKRIKHPKRRKKAREPELLPLPEEKEDWLLAIDAD
jgi:hypothetical protein